VQIIGHDDPGEAPAGERPRVAAFEIGLERRHARGAGERGERLRIAVDRGDFVAERGQQARVAAVPAGEIEHLAFRDEPRPTRHPGRGRDQLVGHAWGW